MQYGTRWLLVAILLTMTAGALARAAEPEAPTSATDEEKKLEAVKEMFQSPYSEEDYYRTDRLLISATGSQLERDEGK